MNNVLRKISQRATNQPAINVPNKSVSEPHTREKKPSGYWLDPLNHQKFFDETAGPKLHVLQLEDWYSVTKNDVIDIGGGVVMHCHNGSISKALSMAYPWFNWESWRFQNAPQGYWEDVKNQRKRYDELWEVLGIEKLSDWYNVTVEDLRANDAGNIINRYNGSLISSLSGIYPEYEWVGYNFVCSPANTWSDLDNHKKKLNDIAIELSIKTYDAWYDVTFATITRLRSLPVLEYHGSLYSALKTSFPEHPWIAWKFRCVPTKFWHDIKNQREKFDDIAKTLNVKTRDGWELKQTSDIVGGGGNPILNL